MAHSRIIQVNEERLSKNNHLTVEDFYDLELGNAIEGFDYATVPDSPREEELKWFKEQLEKVGFALDGEEITVGEDESFISDWREKAVEVAEDFDLWKMKAVASGAFFSGFFIYDKYYGYPVSLWKWAKDVIESRKEVRNFYVGGIIDYHF